MNEKAPHVKAALDIELSLLGQPVEELNGNELRLLKAVVQLLNDCTSSRMELRQQYEDHPIW